VGVFHLSDTARRILIELSELASLPARVPLLPIPGTYDHPSYGEMVISPERIARFVANHNARIYQQHVPIDAEHESKLSGALGYLGDAQIEADGSVTATVEWTARGEALVGGGGFRYVSPEWYEAWTDPAAGATYSDVLIGLAITSRPFFKESALPPLVAREPGGAATAQNTDTTTATVQSKESIVTEPENSAAVDEQVINPAEPVKDEATVTADEVKALTESVMAELAEQFGEKPSISDPVVREFVEKAAKEVATAKAQANRSERTAAELTAQNGRLLEQYELRFFSEEVRGRSDANNTPWIGPVDDHVRMCRFLAEKAGRESWELSYYIQSNRAFAEQLKSSQLFREIGSGHANTGLGAYDRIEIRAKERQRQTPGMTFEKAFDEVLSGDPDLRAAYSREQFSS
jgi:hypothetical protein